MFLRGQQHSRMTISQQAKCGANRFHVLDNVDYANAKRQSDKAMRVAEDVTDGYKSICTFTTNFPAVAFYFLFY